MAPDLGGWLVAGEPKRTRLAFMGFREEMIGRTAVEELKAGIKDRSIEVEDRALIHKSPTGRVSITTDRSIDPGPVEGAVFGGAAGLVLAVIAGMVGGVPVLGGAAIGGLVAALMDSGLDNDHVDAVATLMDAGGTGLIVAVPLDEAARFEAFVDDNVVFEAAISRYQADIVPGRTFEQALEAYRGARGARHARIR
jgi:uncharacterized membrane protein